MSSSSPAAAPPARRLSRTCTALATLISALVLLVSFGATPSLAAPSSSSAPSSSGSAGSTGSTGSTASAGSAGSGRATFGIKPATPGHADARSYFRYQLAPRSAYSDHVAVLNYAASPIVLHVFTTDLTNTASGTLSVAADHASAVDAGAWVAVPASVATVIVPARTGRGPGQVLVPFRVTIPSNATPGDHGAAVVARLSSVGKNSSGQDVRLDQQVATRVLVRVDGPLRPGLQIENLHATYQGTANPVGRGTAHVSYTVRDTGNTILGARQAATLTGLFGTHARIDPADLGEIALLLPGKSAAVSFDVAGVVPTFTETVTVTAHPLVLTSDAATPVASARQSVSFSAVPWPFLAACVLVALLLIAFGWLAVRRRRRGPRAAVLRGKPDVVLS